MFQLGYIENEIVAHDDLCKRAKCGCMGGIRYSKENNVLLLFMKQDSSYNNIWDGNILEFMGSGKGNQSVESGCNRRLTYSEKNNTAIYLFEWINSINLKYIGRMNLCKKPEKKIFTNKFGNGEEKVIFYLRQVKD